MLLKFLALVIAGLAVIAAYLMKDSFVAVDEGHLGFFYFGGKLLNQALPPGYHFKVPIYEFVQLPTNIRTYVIRDAKCGTESGILLNFDKIEVVYRVKSSGLLELLRHHGPHFEVLAFEQLVRFQLNEICSSRTLQEIYIYEYDQLDEWIQEGVERTYREHIPTMTSISIANVRLSSVTIPYAIKKEFEKIEEYRSLLRVKERERELILSNQTMILRKESMQATKELELSLLKNEQDLRERESKIQGRKIELEGTVKRIEEEGNNILYQKTKQAESNERKLTPRFLHFLRSKAILENIQLFVGKQIPAYIFHQDEY